MHRRIQRNPQHVQGSEDCLVFFRVRFSGLFLLDLCSSGFGFRSGQRRLGTVFRGVAYSAAEHAKVVVETTLSFLLGEFSVLTKLIG